MLDVVSPDQLRAFIAAVDEGRFSAVRRKLYGVQSAAAASPGARPVSSREAGSGLVDRLFRQLLTTVPMLTNGVRAAGLAAGNCRL